MRVHTDENRRGRAQRGNLRQRQVNKDHAALHHMDTQVGMYASQDEAGEKRKN